MLEAGAPAASWPEWQIVCLTALLTTIGTAFVSYISHRLTVRRDIEAERERHGTYLAVRVASVLDLFVMSAVEVVRDNGFRDPEGELHPEARPPVLDLPQDVDWKSIDPPLMDRILSMPNEIASAEETISFTGQMISGPPDYEEWFDERRYQWARLGLMALDLARDLRERYGLRQPDYSRDDPREVLEAAFRKEGEMREQGVKSATRLAATARPEAAKS